MLNGEQKQKLSSLLAQEHVAVVTTQGDEWPTATMQAFAETDTLDIILIMLESAPKFLNLQKRPNLTLHVDTRDSGDVRSFQIIRAWVEGVAREVPRGSTEWENCKTTFLKKNPFEEPFFQYDTLRMVRVTPKRISYANGLGDSFKADY
jgi:hypothetical protein